MIYLLLFWEFFIIGTLSFGGGYAVLPLIEQNIVEKQAWISATEFVDLLTISELTPGPIAINAATYAGNRVAGIPGGIVATLGVVAPSLVIVLLLAYLYKRYKELPVIQRLITGLRPAIVALIASAGMTILLTAFFGTEPASLSNLNWMAVSIFAISFYILEKFNADPIKIIIFTGILGGIIYTAFPAL